MNSHSYVTGILVVCGWLFLIWNSNRIARRSEIRSACDRLIGHLFDFKDEYFTSIESGEFKPCASDYKADPVATKEKCDQLVVHLESRISLHSTLAEQLNEHIGSMTGVRPVPQDLFVELNDGCLSNYADMFHKGCENDILSVKLCIQRTVNDYITCAVSEVEKTYIRHYAKTAFFKSIKKKLYSIASSYPAMFGISLAIIALYVAYQIGLFSPCIEACLRHL